MKIYDVIKVPVFHPDGQTHKYSDLGRDILNTQQLETNCALGVDCRVFRRRYNQQNLTGTSQMRNAGAPEDLRLLRGGNKGAAIEILAIPERPNGNA